ncbi:hypothetical protein CXK86_28245 [Paenibacillus sp. BGI2013]|nr:hypothetical protein BK136_16360 [Paenibacillus amylolyticus]PKQ87868.1 hypothetical protein CXK86_28245 [Paenibacillus sp. BGI2013]
MFIIVATKGSLKWVSGVFQAEDVARQYMDLIPEELKGLPEIHSDREHHISILYYRASGFSI